MNKKILKIITAVTAVTILAAFTDVPADNWAYTYVAQAQEFGIVKGISDELFEPEREVSKQEMSLILYRVLNIFDPLMTSEDYTEEYKEAISKGNIAEWSAKEVCYGFKYSFWNTDDFAKGSAQNSADRKLIAKWLFSATPGLKTFGLRVFKYGDNKDISSADYSFVDAMYKYGIMRGDGTNFNPNKGVSRAEAATVALRMKDIIAGRSNMLSSEPLVYEKGIVSNVDTKKQTLSLGDALINIAEGAEIIIDGQPADFADIKKLNKKDAVFSLCVNGENTNSVVIQTKPVSVSGTVEKITKKGIGSAQMDIISINIGGVLADYIKDYNTDVIKSVKEGTEVSFIADGVYLLEIR